MTSPTDNRNTESVCANFGAENVASNFEANWRSWGQVNLATIAKREDINETSIIETMERAKLFFEPYYGDVRIYNPVNSKLEIDPDYKAVFNPGYDKHLAIVGQGFNAMSHYDTLKGVFGEILDRGWLPARFISFECGGRMLAQFVVSEEFHAAGRVHNGFATVYNAINGKSKAMIGFTLYTPICTNTFQAALSDIRDLSAKHTKNMATKLQSIKSQLFEIKGEGEKTLGLWDKWATVPASKSVTEQFLSAMIPATDSNASKNRQTELLTAINLTCDEPNRPCSTPTAYDLFAGVTRYVANRQQNRDGFEQYEYVTTGVGATLANKAANWLSDYVNSL